MALSKNNNFIQVGGISLPENTMTSHLGDPDVSILVRNLVKDWLPDVIIILCKNLNVSFKNVAKKILKFAYFNVF
jgi:hypothetical protein